MRTVVWVRIVRGTEYQTDPDYEAWVWTKLSHRVEFPGVIIDDSTCSYGAISH